MNKAYFGTLHNGNGTPDIGSVEVYPSPHRVTIELRAASIALMFANIHAGDGDCLGVAARELIKLLDGRGIDPPDDFNC